MNGYIMINGYTSSGKYCLIKVCVICLMFYNDSGSSSDMGFCEGSATNQYCVLSLV